MIESLESWVRALAAAGLFTGAVLSLAPGGRSGKVLRLVCALLLLAVLLSPLWRLDYDAYAEELSRQRLLGLDLSAKGEAESLRLLGSVIQQRTEAYILDQAAALGPVQFRMRIIRTDGGFQRVDHCVARHVDFFRVLAFLEQMLFRNN